MLHTPSLGSSVFRRREHFVAIIGENRAQQCVLVAFERHQALAGAHAPNLGGLVIGRRQDHLAIGRINCRIHRICVPLQRELADAGIGVPKLRRAILRARQDRRVRHPPQLRTVGHAELQQRQCGVQPLLTQEEFGADREGRLADHGLRQIRQQASCLKFHLVRWRAAALAIDLHCDRDDLLLGSALGLAVLLLLELVGPLLGREHGDLHHLLHAALLGVLLALARQALG
mmetsp:Transcript_22568/g.63474  ORF Transcript_22568/g.63474 Transcript_22568/m.63474 type:complete len:230 (+) Transcript_22568:428-1117(+)